MRVLLIRPFLDIYDVLSKAGGTHYPINLMYLCAYLKREGHKVALIDYEVDSSRIRHLYTEIQQGQYDIVGITSMTPSYSNACSIARIIKKKFPEILIIFGGVHPTMLPEDVLLENPVVDYVVRGEGEITFTELLKTVESSRLEGLSSIKGLSYRKDGHTTHNPDREFVKNLDSLPFPDHSCIVRERYSEPLSLGQYRDKHNQIAEIFTSRGCPFHCKFCSNFLVMGNACRWRSVENVMAEIDDLIRNQHYNYIFFHDDNFTLNRSRVFALCKALQKRKIRWSCLTRVDIIDDEMIRVMKAAGCDKILFGVESGSLRVLRQIQKQTTPMQIVEAFRLVHKYKIKTQAFIIVGYPTETVADINKTIALLKRINPDFLFVSHFTPYPGTESYQQAIEKGYLKKGNWDNFLFIAGQPAARSDNFTKKELMHWQRKVLTAYILRIQYLLQKIVSLRNLGDIRYYANAALSFFRFVK